MVIDQRMEKDGEFAPKEQFLKDLDCKEMEPVKGLVSTNHLFTFLTFSVDPAIRKRSIPVAERNSANGGRSYEATY